VKARYRIQHGYQELGQKTISIRMCWSFMISSGIRILFENKEHGIVTSARTTIPHGKTEISHDSLSGGDKLFGESTHYRRSKLHGTMLCLSLSAQTCNFPDQPSE
jgi:hypothetical protein